MSLLQKFILFAGLAAVVCATPTPKDWSSGGNLKPGSWLSPSKLESLKSADELTLQQLEDMPIKKGSEMMQHLYHLSQIDYQIQPEYAPSASDIRAYIVKPDGRNESVSLSQLVDKVKKDPSFGDDEVTIFITGLPSPIKAVTKATKKIVEAYDKRYNGPRNRSWNKSKNNKNSEQDSSSSEENSSEEDNNTRGDLVVIDLGSSLTTVKRLATLDVKKTGDMIGKELADLTKEADVPEDVMHIVAQGIASHVAGAAARQYTRLTGQKLHRITALDPSKMFAKNPSALNGLARGDAKFVDAIHTSVYGMGTHERVGDIDFYPNGPSAAVPGADNLVEATMRATDYFAETVTPGKERNFPAVPARSLEEYRNHNGYGKRTYMGIDADCDLEGDYILEVNSEAPFGRKASARIQNRHSQHQAKNSPKSAKF